MKPISFVIEPRRHRQHRALFDNELPFRGRKEQSKIAFRRKPKYPQKEEQW